MLYGLWRLDVAVLMNYLMACIILLVGWRLTFAAVNQTRSSLATVRRMQLLVVWFTNIHTELSPLVSFSAKMSLCERAELAFLARSW